MTHGLGVRDAHKDRYMSKPRRKKYRKAQRHKNRDARKNCKGLRRKEVVPAKS